MFDGIYIDELVELRAAHRIAKDWVMCDKLRDYLDTKNVFIYDTSQGQEVYFMPNNFCGGRAYLEKEIKREKVAQKNFDSWLFSVRAKIKANESRI